ncbi:hypothetical protein A3D84_00195 [Candidatus Woesebacteria bacterium RIFCSPHIGHO2_02_FULL_42_20]|uniref:Glycosyltransferase RgtA/B/C/D-like domain-containing protein n=1 Tax=Candidatus Woesebacteria bacterium RIFCSPHIGHO2_12_FULL_41_24 TaxID=1802510 RepID=A0A1F8ATM6_9BACT|nr:MAG: hypothetical protein A2W15_01695 [Candidatus Woesebacteria bacterium RBG_16_41_13]OGM29671.1 MAG: hypothetical protein A2873_02115 [Candidatus Woesebacteria bacterium RIFCSPHIGHO2_01_FULL_42_80]OGM35200.1 MAG: hypothetical protein A3D84_00195 [Candidatus Woesebacteria bacterium RIFCSPHIGHO2_02_FULL_42_20]OGM55093.1 MAG: hypothetical protein A3E44_04200 [Candidatus Woesebacteria bacterium RIFCSPHIGHO2_12_FULL_41_24]OGM67666.1 MAG: hypothetical protein A2969_01905 [Candidatus Woesebacteri
MLKKFFPLAFVLAFNLWIWKIFAFNAAVGLVVIGASVSLWLEFQENTKFHFYATAGLFFILLLFQWKTSSVTSLTYLTEHEKLGQQVRMRGYPPLAFNIAGKTVWLPAANWLEKRKETLIFYKIQTNISEIIDPNLFFFANHPRERVGVVEFEKFPYIFLPAFLLGLASIQKKQVKDLFLGFLPIALIALIGNSNPAGPFAFFPVFAVLVSIGLAPLFLKKKLLIACAIVFVPVFIQVVSYAKY